MTKYFFGETKFFIFPQREYAMQCGKMKNFATPKKIFRQIDFLVISLHRAEYSVEKYYKTRRDHYFYKKINIFRQINVFY